MTFFLYGVKMMFFNKTEKIKEVLNNRKQQYLLLKETQEEFDFFKDIKPAFDEFELIVLEWQQLFEKEKIVIKYIHEDLIERTKVQALELFIQSYQHKTSKKMFLQLFKTVEYVLDSIIANKKTN